MAKFLCLSNIKSVNKSEVELDKDGFQPLRRLYTSTNKESAKSGFIDYLYDNKSIIEYKDIQLLSIDDYTDKIDEWHENDSICTLIEYLELSKDEYNHVIMGI